MQTLRWVTPSFALLLLLVVATCSDNTQRPTPKPQCEADTDCTGSAGTCATFACEDEVCKVVPLAAGTPAPNQVAGNCHAVQCDGSGGTTTVVDDNNRPTTNTPCAVGICTSGTPSSVSVEQGTACGTGLVCNGAGDCIGCIEASECPGSNSQCQTVECNGGTCGINFTVEGTPLSSQTHGDCEAVVCNGSGGTETVVDDNNLPTTSNPCLQAICTDGVPSNPPQAEGITCGSGSADLVCNGSGACVGCNLPSDCPGSDTDCIVRACTDNVCGSADVAQGTPLPANEQPVGNCQELVCNGSGSDASVADDSNLPSSSNPCLQNVCTSGVPSNPNQPDGTVCNTTDVCDTINGVGTCLPPLTGSAGQTWQAAAGWTGGTPCLDGIRFNVDGSFVWGCSTTAGFFVATGGSNETFAASNTGLDNLNGIAIGVHSNVPGIVLFSSSSSGSNNWYQSSNDGATWTAHPIDDANGVPRTIASSRFQQQVGGLWTTFDDVAGTAAVLTGATTPTATHAVTFNSTMAGSAATGTARAIVPGMGGGTTDLLLAVFGQQPGGAAGTGGVFKGTTKGAVWNESDSGIAASDKNLVFSIIAAADVATSGTLYVALQGGGQVYKTTDDGASWAQANSGLPAGAVVNAIAIDASNTSILYAATSNGLWESTDGATTWTLAGFSGRSVVAVTVSPAAGDDANIFVGVNDDVGVYVPGP
jgi:hypothetical protein